MSTRRISREWFEDKYLLAAGLIVLSVLVYAFAGGDGIGQLFVVAVQGVTLLVILGASSVSVRWIRIVSVLVVVVLVVTSLSVALDDRSVGPSLAGSLLAIVAPIAIVQRVKRHPRIDLATVAASLCVYLLAGLFFANLYRAVHVVQGPFFAGGAAGSPVDFVYFSFTTLTTLGYGDLTSRLNLGRMLAISEALLGQLYLVSVVALFVGNIGRTRARPAERGETPE